MFAFADENLILTRSPTDYSFADIVWWILAEIHSWAIKCSLEFGYDKCMYVVIPRKGKMEKNPSRVIWIVEQNVKFFRKISYLWVIFVWSYS